MLFGVTTLAQEPKPTFEVASIRVRTAPNPTNVVVRSTPGAFNRESASVLSLIQFGYDLLGFQVVGGPDWIRTQRFDIAARMDVATTPAQTRLMVQSLLEDRFQLKARRESREMRGLVLVQSNPKQFAATTKPSKDCSERVEMPKNVPTNSVRVSGCTNMTAFALSVARQLSVPVIDRTGLSGSFAYQMFYAPEEARDVPGEPNAPAYTTALQEQLGLKLEATRGPVEVLVIASVQQPTEN